MTSRANKVKASRRILLKDHSLRSNCPREINRKEGRAPVINQRSQLEPKESAAPEKPKESATPEKPKEPAVTEKPPQPTDPTKGTVEPAHSKADNRAGS